MNVEVDFKDVRFKMCIPTIEMMETYPGGNVQRSILDKKVWAEEETIILSTILKLQSGLVVDIGANTGYFTLLALSKGCPVLAFEPNAVHTQYLTESVKLNNFQSDLLKHHELFVSSTTHDVLFDGWSAYEGICETHKSTLTKTIALDSVISECLFLKIDVEGYEPDVIKSADSLLRNTKIPYIMFEITYIVDDKIDVNQVNMLNTFIFYGFDLFEIQPRTLITIENIDAKVNKWNDEYFNIHKKHNPSITSGGGNILAIHKTAVNPFLKVNGHDVYILQ